MVRHEGELSADNVLCFDPGNGYTSVLLVKNSLLPIPNYISLCM